MAPRPLSSTDSLQSNKTYKFEQRRKRKGSSLGKWTLTLAKCNIRSEVNLYYITRHNYNFSIIETLNNPTSRTEHLKHGTQLMK